jgi:hypothetical protein
MTTKRPMFPPAIDSTLLGSFRTCPQKAFRTYVQHYKPQSESVHLIAGGAFAAGLEVARRSFFEEGNSQTTSVAKGLQKLLLHYGDFQCPSESAKSPERMAGALEYYFANYPLGGDGMVPIKSPSGDLGIEFSFAEPLPILHPQTGLPLLYTGRADMISDFAGGIFVVDDKTTSSLGASWSRQWELRSQFTGYVWACRQSGMLPAGAIVRGVSILKTKYDTQQVIIYFPEWEVNRWYGQLLRDVNRMIECWKEGYWDFSLDHGCAEYGGCSLQRICKSENPEPWLEAYFEQRVWDPLARKEVTVEEWEAQWLGNIREI